MTSAKGLKGFTLIELMIAIAIMGILLAIAVPNYSKYMRESRRAAAQSDMLQMRVGMEKWRANKISYRSDADTTNTATTNTAANAGFTGTNDYYTYSITAGDNTYTITATAVAGKSQVNDKTGSGTSCTPMSINQSGTKTPAGCWKK
jgi:type IV pilus assembly protein PilE